MGKGSVPRPVNKAKFDLNYTRIFGTEDAVQERRREFIRKAHEEQEQSDMQTISPLDPSTIFAGFVRF